MSRGQGLLSRPILAILAAALVAALFVFKDFGMTWDEPLFYDYADALPYAYNPANWLSGAFDLTNSYGPSAEDHKTHGPAYLLVARPVVAAVRALGVDRASSWHLVNFATFLIAVYFVYRMGRWVAGEKAALLGAALFLTQPLLFGHAFINPKDVPFMVVFAGAVWMGVHTVDGLVDQAGAGWPRGLWPVLLSAALLGLATANRVLGPLAGGLVALYWLARRPRLQTLGWLALYGISALAVTFACWPYLWEDASRFFEVFGLMAQNPTVLQVLFADSVYRANQLPLRYLPFHLVATLTEPVWILVGLGALTTVLSARRGAASRLRGGLLWSWLIFPLIYVALARPPMYDGMRHFLFLVPPVFAIGAAGIDLLWRRIQRSWARWALSAVLLAPGIAGIISLHSYEYTYYNALTGGTGGAFRRYETDYWLTCYKEAVEELNTMRTESLRLFVHREPEVARPYAAPHVEVLAERGSRADMHSGDYILVNTRTNEDLRTFRDAPALLTVGRVGATFCVIKAIP